MPAITDLSKSYGAQTLFREATMTFAAPNCYGVVGANGSGKSTLLRLLARDEEPSGGEISIPKKSRLGVLRQDHFSYEELPILDVVSMGNRVLWEAMVAKEALLERAHESFDGDRYAQLEETVLQFDGYSLEARAAEILAGLNIPHDAHRQPLSSLSGGFKLRVLLAQTLAADPDVLLLDEPTNHLDILSIRWLEKFIEAFPGCTLVVSHDHRFLNNVCTHIVDVDYERITLYRGNYNQFIQSKHDNRARKEAEIAKREKEIATHRQAVERFRAKPTKARQAQSQLKRIDRIVIEDLPRSSRRYPKFSFSACRSSGRQVVELQGICKAYDGKSVLEDVTLRVMRGERIAIIGPNGIGKSTLLKIMVDTLDADSGTVEWGYETHPGYFAQDHRELLEGARDTLQSWLWNHCPGQPIGYVRGHLARVLFQKDEADKKVANLSGGEAARLIFAKLAVTEPNCLVLDEPTNHLDLEGIEALAEGLDAYDGTVLFVSHDRWFVSRLATRVIEITADGLRDFAGTYDEYLTRCGDDHLDIEAVVRRAREAKRRSRDGQAGSPSG
jgi:ATPase subunit of ABC transporter with duplicated ATPase domains